MRLKQVLAILIDNAIAHTPIDTTIKLILSSDTSSLSICVSDNGNGIQAADKNRIFDRFYQLDHSRHQKDHYGLGLSIAYEIIKLHSGTLIVKDTIPHGATFEITLPRS